MRGVAKGGSQSQKTTQKSRCFNSIILWCVICHYNISAALNKECDISLLLPLQLQSTKLG